MERRLSSLRTRIFVSASVLVLIATLILTALFGNLLRNDLVLQFQDDLTLVSQFQGERTALIIDGIRHDVLMAASTHPVQGIMRSLQDGHAYQGDTLDGWRQRMGHYFSAIINSHADYLQIRLIGLADNGREWVRVNQVDGKSVIVTPDQLQQKGGRDYFKATLALKPGEVYLSDINLNREFGQLEQPYRPTLRVSTPVFTDSGEMFAMVVINMDATRVLHQINLNLPEQIQFYIANSAGDWLTHPNASRQFGFDIGKTFRWQDEFPELVAEQQADGFMSPSMTTVATAQGSLQVLARSLPFDPLAPERMLTFFYGVPKALIEERIWPMYKALITSSIVVGLSVLLLTLITVNRVLSPLHQINAAADDLAEGRYETQLPGTGTREINSLVKAFHVMRERIRQREKEYQQLTSELELRVKARTADMTTARAESEAANVAKSQFLANMSHEIRTPLNAILGMAYVLEKQDLTDDATGLVQRICTAGRTLLRVINDILDFSKIEAGHLDIENAPFHLASVLDNLAAIMASSARDKDIELIITPPAVTLGGIRGDALRLEQVLVNLTSNAIKFTRSGQVKVRVQCIHQDRNGVRLQFEVSDTGIGISDEQIQRIFAPFAQADASTTRHFGGTGLGLSICRQLIQLMGGDLAVSSKPGEGSQFNFELPLGWSREKLLSQPEMSSLNILIAANQPDVCEALQATATALGWQPVLVSSTEAAVKDVLTQHSAGKPFDVVILDWQLSDTDGLTAAHSVRNSLEDQSETIFLMVSSFTHANNAAALDGAPVDGVLTKPITASTLYDATIHAIQSRNGDTPAEDADAAPQGERLPGIRLLVVDDSEINREVAQRIFSAEGASVALANDGQQALAWLYENHRSVDVVLMDIQMPLMDGYEATRAIRRSPKLNAIPVVALTAGAFKSQQEAAFAAGMNDFISKPFDVDAAIAIVQRLAGLTPDPVKPAIAAHPGHHENSTLPGLNISRGLKVWRDAARYQQYLRKFARDYGNCVKKIQLSDALEGARIAHKLKGAAGNLALDDVANLAHQTERQLGEQGSAAGALAELQTAIDTALASIAQYAEPSGNPTLEESTAVKAGTLSTVLQEALQAFDSDNPDNIESLLPSLQTVLSQHQIEPLLKALEDFDFRAGKYALIELAHALGISLEQSHDSPTDIDR